MFYKVRPVFTKLTDVVLFFTTNANEKAMQGPLAGQETYSEA